MHDHWADVLRVICCAFIAAVSTVFGNLAIAYGKEAGLNESITLWLVVVASFFALFTQPVFGRLADRVGRMPVFVYGALSSAALMPLYPLSMSAGSELLTFALAGGVQEGGWSVTAGFTAVIAPVATVSALTARETKDVPTAELGLERRADVSSRDVKVPASA
jgi:MFS family permease